MFEIIFWQKIVSPHMACLVREMACLGHNVRYVAEKHISADRQQQGWTPPDISGVGLQLIGRDGTFEEILTTVSDQAIHVLQGLRGNGVIQQIAVQLRQKRARWGAVMETVQESPFGGLIKRQVYRWLLNQGSPDFVLAIGEKTPHWIASRRYPQKQIFPFTYFLEKPRPEINADNFNKAKALRIGFVGNLFKRKRVDLLVNALMGMNGVELIVVGDGPLRSPLEALSRQKLAQITSHWLGQMPMEKARQTIATLDCLVLPSDHDGWGAVVSEALMAGVPAICSDRCGAAAAVVASGVGGVFPKGNVDALRSLLMKMQQERLDPFGRERLAEWARCFSAPVGAKYLNGIFQALYNQAGRPLPPWLTNMEKVGLKTNDTHINQ